MIKMRAKAGEEVEFTLPHFEEYVRYFCMEQEDKYTGEESEAGYDR